MEDLAYESLREKDKEFIKSSIRAIPDFPKQGIMFRDITTLLNNPEAFKKVVEIFVERYKDRQIDVVAGIESRGFIFGAILAEKLSARFVPIRKPGKLPGEVERQEYELEYGKDAVEIHKDAINVGDRVLIIDDLLATSGTMKA
ncbi:MAG: adenine phosphoribosyltransferase, partial [Candidatus Pacearchaeota archaeon]|nr:adenine phosphoribosyltransferase [Candidatus Pacearchaeota archaeon]